MTITEYVTLAGVLLGAAGHLVAIGILYQRLRSQIEHLRADTNRQERQLTNGLESRLRKVEIDIATLRGRNEHD